ncbi:hypothetical protein NDU88_000048 [Pleurodeles waltl]|uniref:Uncharacterized protein n=1 Tax=Pleurodeles waltl TaxID=8319 RepID=A0AAV7L5Q6_PLEWA|nr:hypothetical protein NDU88_000048 [Pleurodeles waltl]
MIPRLAQFKYFHRLYYDPTRLWRVGRTPASAVQGVRDPRHILPHDLVVPASQQYCRSDCGTVSRAVGRPFDLGPKVILLGLMDDIGGPLTVVSLVALGYIIAKKDIAWYWDVDEPPAITEWMRGMDICGKLEEMVYKD